MDDQFHPMSQKKLLEEVEKLFIAPSDRVVQDLCMGLSINIGNGICLFFIFRYGIFFSFIRSFN